MKLFGMLLGMAFVTLVQGPKELLVNVQHVDHFAVAGGSNSQAERADLYEFFATSTWTLERDLAGEVVSEIGRLPCHYVVLGHSEGIEYICGIPGKMYTFGKFLTNGKQTLEWNLRWKPRDGGAPVSATATGTYYIKQD